MAKDKALTMAKKLGKVTKKLPSGMYETSTKDRIPAYPGISIGDSVSIGDNGHLVIPEKETPKGIGEEAHVTREEFEALKKENEALSKIVGEKGADVKTTAKKGADSEEK